ncbi:terpenoid cyclases/protein prenyltransferase alpha-alpha toroid [Aspergillus pseudonomiae]|uniref:protein geranylgeranyltransferase type II n=1 Tax=Aspergillus pseudonomiae TaxID=1506151 RepID=A0A5N7DCH6_9EURO|nr:terpenoid cyclases/protein prenyltransferase alpha-alpha toroid [Aspergillus pseudonomiae]KAE8404102.1 terpenoid cyclases/protein prenyltransferase alpha-alpha toroid [Aspergillus pseudonomiae]
MSLVSGGGQTDQYLCVQKHVEYIKNLDSRRDELEYWLTEHLRLNGVYWGLTALHLLGCPQALPREDTISFVLSCQRENGGFGAAPGHDAHMLYTVSAVQILVMLDAVDELEKRGLGGKRKVGSFIAGLQDKETGSFMGDEWGELDTRFLYGAFNALSLLGLLDTIDVPKAVAYVQKCENLDGGYGIHPGAESHSGQVFTCVGALAIAGRLDLINKDRLGGWLSERQVDNGGFNGRPEKLEDACYSWWVGASLAMIDKLHWINGDKLAAFILRCQDPENGGFGDRPGNMVDVFHTHFALAGLSLLGYDGVGEVDPVYHQESQAVILLDEYDRWYKANNLAKLLSDRLASKDARRKRIHGTAAPHDKTCPAKEDHGHKSPTGPVRSPHGNALPDYLDPRLVTSGVYMEHDDSDRGTYVSADCVTGVASPNRDVQANAESSHLLHPTPGSQISTEAAACQWKQERVFGSDDEGGFDLECTPSWSKTLGHTAQMASQLLNRQLLSYDPLVDDIESEVDKDRVDEIARLKGVLWPGMDIFDSATAQMRRKRNQKKDESALRMMEKTSMGVEPTELIFSPTGILRKQRVISGNVEDSSPLKGETPIPRRRSTRLKRALSQTDANIQRGQDRKRKKKVVKHVPITVGQDLNHRDSYFTRATSPEAPSGGNQLTHGESADDFALTFNGPESRSRTGLKIFCDTPNQNISDQHCGDGLHFGLVASSDALFLQQEATTTRTPSSVLSSNYISEFAERLCRFTTDKENIDPLSDAHGRIDPLVGWHSPVIKRHLASNTGYPSQFLFGDSQRIELNMFDGHDSHVGYSYNPLAASFPKLSAEENPIYTMDTSNGLSFQDATYVTSPEATISDIEDDDFERLYLDGSSC